MRESDYYPAGAYSDPNAPYNEPMIPERDFEVSVAQVLTKEDTVKTDQYVQEYDDEDGHIYANTDDTDWEKVYEENNCTPKQLIDVCKKIAQWAVGNGTKNIDGIHLPSIIEACDGWNVEELTVEER